MLKFIVLIFINLIFCFTVFSQQTDSLLQTKDKIGSMLIEDVLIKSSPKSDTTLYSTNNTEKPISYGRFVFALFVVTALLFAFYLFAKKKYGVKKISSSTTNLDVLEELSIGVNRLYIVRVSNRVMVVGAGSSGVNHIHTFDKEETMDILSSYDEGMDGSTSGKFSEIINGFLDKYKEK